MKKQLIVKEPPPTTLVV